MDVGGGAWRRSIAAQEPDLTGLPAQVEKLNAGQEALRKELQAMQRQLQQITSLLKARPAQPAAAPQPPLPAELVTDGAPFKGSPDAPLTIVEFSDFQCPFCRRHWQQTYGQLDRDYISTGKVRYVFRHFPLERIHPQALKASEATECAAAQGKFWEMHDRLFANQQALMPADLVKHAQALGLGRDTLRGLLCRPDDRPRACGSRHGSAGRCQGNAKLLSRRADARRENQGGAQVERRPAVRHVQIDN